MDRGVLFSQIRSLSIFPGNRTSVFPKDETPNDHDQGNRNRLRRDKRWRVSLSAPREIEGLAAGNRQAHRKGDHPEEKLAQRELTVLWFGHATIVSEGAYGPWQRQRTN